MIFTNIVDQLLDPHAQLVLLGVVVLPLDRRERGGDVFGRGAAHVVDQEGQVLWGLQLDLAVGAVHRGRGRNGICVCVCVCACVGSVVVLC